MTGKNASPDFWIDAIRKMGEKMAEDREKRKQNPTGIDIAFFYQESVYHQRSEGELEGHYEFRAVIFGVSTVNDIITPERKSYSEVFADLFKFSIENRIFLREASGEKDVTAWRKIVEDSKRIIKKNSSEVLEQ